MTIMKIYAIGWDVRGWQSEDQATAVAKFDLRSNDFSWLGISPLFRFQSGTKPSLKDLVVPACGTAGLNEILASDNCVVAIDAPLSLPKALITLANGYADDLVVPEREIDNPLAYRDCERWIKAKLGKKPLSASFDKLGNNASLAQSVALRLKAEGFTIVPQKGATMSKAVIEVYPGLLKVGNKTASPVRDELKRYIPKSLELGSDQYDAAICALVGLSYMGAGSAMAIGDTLPFDRNFDRSEGWIYTII
tara:strand:- start:9869 stop:10618 length:750 start_codon:yes stop_codon:yes gene_type:complete